jgi:hypothetical protein
MMAPDAASVYPTDLSVEEAVTEPGERVEFRSRLEDEVALVSFGEEQRPGRG